MEEPGTVQVNERNFALPILLISLVFFSLYLVILFWILLIMLRLLLGVILPPPAWDGITGIFPVVAIGFFLLVSLSGAILFIREMKAQSRPWKTGIPLCFLLGVIIVPSVFFLSESPASIQTFPGLITLAGFISLPYGVAYLLLDFRTRLSDESKAFSNAIGLFGLLLSGILALSTTLASLMQTRDDVGYLAIFFVFLQITILMPMLGVKLFKLGLSFFRIPPPVVEVVGASEPVPRKKLADVLKSLPLLLSKRVKWTLLILFVLVLVVAGCYVYWDITDTTPCRKWTQATVPAPFGYKEGFTSAEYKGKLWVIGGTNNSGPNGEAWFTSDGITWNHESSADMVPQRLGATTGVFRDALWILGGKDNKTGTPGNDIWYSNDGIAWTEIQPKTIFPPRSGHSTVVFRDRIWVIGGNSGYLTNDIWSSEDGITWRQETPAAEFSPRAGHSAFVYHDQLWIIGWRDYTWRDDTQDQTDVWNSNDGITWTLVAVPEVFEHGSPVSVAVFDDRIWAFQDPHTWDCGDLWCRESPKGIWYSYDALKWTKVKTSPEFFKWEYYNGQPPLPIVFQNRLYVLQGHKEKQSGIWYTGSSGKTAS